MQHAVEGLGPRISELDRLVPNDAADPKWKWSRRFRFVIHGARVGEKMEACILPKVSPKVSPPKTPKGITQEPLASRWPARGYEWTILDSNQ